MPNVVVVTYNRKELTQICIDSILEKTRGRFTLTVVDNGSQDGTIELLQQYEQKNYIHNLVCIGRNMGIAVAANLGWLLSKDDAYIKLDNDIEVIDGHWMEYLVDVAASNPTIGMVGYKFCDWHKTERRVLDSGHTLQVFESCGGGCALIPHHVHQRLGFWNEDYGLYGYEDLEYGVRANMDGYITGYIDRENVLAHRGFSAGNDAQHESVKSKSIAKEKTGQKLYLLNKFMFEKKLRPLLVQRKYLHRLDSENRMQFRVNAQCKSLYASQRHLLQTMQITLVDGIAQIDLRGFVEGA